MILFFRVVFQPRKNFSHYQIYQVVHIFVHLPGEQTPGVVPNLHVLCALVSALGGGSRWRQALEVYTQAPGGDAAMHGAAWLGTAVPSWEETASLHHPKKCVKAVKSFWPRIIGLKHYVTFKQNNYFFERPGLHLWSLWCCGSVWGWQPWRKHSNGKPRCSFSSAAAAMARWRRRWDRSHDWQGQLLVLPSTHFHLILFRCKTTTTTILYNS